MAGHAAYYAIWDKFVTGELAYNDNCSAQEKAVYWIATLESQVMNGGFGQYLTNTDGLYVTETHDCLEQIGAESAHALLMTAVELARRFDSYDMAWEEKSEEYSALDDEFLEAAEDLAGLTAEAFAL